MKDKTRQFEDLAELLYDIYDDFGAVIKIDLTPQQLEDTLNIIERQEFPSKFRQMEIVKGVTNVVENVNE